MRRPAAWASANWQLAVLRGVLRRWISPSATHRSRRLPASARRWIVPGRGGRRLFYGGCAMLTIDVRSANHEEQNAAIGVITLAFSSDPMARWALPDPAMYLSVMPEIARAFGGNGFAHGTVHLVDGGLAAAMWLPPNVEPDSERLAEITEEHVPKDRLDDMM